MDVYKSASSCSKSCSSYNLILSSTHTTDNRQQTTATSASLHHSILLLYQPRLPSPDMSQPPDPQEEHSRIDWRFPAREGEPSIVLGSFGLKTQITLYYRTLGLGSFEVKQIMEVLYRRWERKFGPLPEPRSWDWFDQDNRLNIAVDRSKDEDHPWEYTPFNVGKYMVSGLTDNVKLGLIVRFGDEEINQIPGGQHVGSNLPCVRKSSQI